MGRTWGRLPAGNGVCEGWCGDCEGCGLGELKTVLLFISSVPMTVDLLTELSRGDFKIVSGTNVIVSNFIEADVVSSYSFSSVCVRRSGV